MTLNAAKAAISFALTLVMISYMPVSGNRYFTENCYAAESEAYVSLKYLLQGISKNLLSLDS
ncbi:MAG: hypothetical protein WBE34_11770, partial [Candidatus Nitrosopolaris sp.]